MAHVLVDDLDKTVHSEETPVRSRHFAFGPAGEMTTYTVDLTEKNYQRLVEALKPFLDLEGTKEVGERPAVPEKRSQARSKEELAAVRTWAGKNGHTVAPRGRISSAVLAAFDEAQKSN